jgi:ABC-2 family transporter protein
MERAAMIRLTWRQFRTQAVVASGLLAAIAVALAVTGPQLVHLYHTSVVPCQARGDCSLATSAFTSRYSLLQGLGVVLVVVPGIIGVFWGAPLIARELETGTYKLIWTQSVTRRRWLAAKLGLVGLASIAVTGLLSLMLTWWSSPIDRVNADPFTVFDQRDIVPFGYAAFAFALGVTAGLLLRRTLPAMVATLAVFAGVRLAVRESVRPYLIAPLRVTSVVRSPDGSLPGGLAANLKPGNWILSDNTINAAGQVIGQDGTINYGGGSYGILFGRAEDGEMTLRGVGPCPNQFPVSAGAAPGGKLNPAFQQAATEYLAKLRIREVLTYQPTSRYWPLQCHELGIFAALALVLAGFCWWWVRRRYA